MQYHPSRRWLMGKGYDPRLAKKYHIPRAASLYARGQMLKHPAVVLHELAHAPTLPVYNEQNHHSTSPPSSVSPMLATVASAHTTLLLCHHPTHRRPTLHPPMDHSSLLRCSKPLTYHSTHQSAKAPTNLLLIMVRRFTNHLPCHQTTRQNRHLRRRQIQNRHPQL